ncbi:hypothetical protein ACFSRY_19080 [Pontibacter locisalis]|uniref:Uncharacterized protein n=1 Tax=Pontibacter locisalis TaxID=1719035 RepID=A0ABW5IQP9_9BACT
MKEDINLFNFSLENNELEKFIVGMDNYFIADRECGGHWAYGNYEKYIKRFLKLNKDVFPLFIWEKLIHILNTSEDINLFLDYLVGFLIPYYNSGTEKVNRNRKMHTPNLFISEFKKTMNQQKKSLLKDTRGTGVEWHSSNGLWGSIIENLNLIQERGGPNLLPTE